MGHLWGKKGPTLSKKCARANVWKNNVSPNGSFLLENSRYTENMSRIPVGKERRDYVRDIAFHAVDGKSHLPKFRRENPALITPWRWDPSDEYWRNLPPEYQAQRLTNHDLPLLSQQKIILVAIDAGAGHKRPLIALNHTLDDTFDISLAYCQTFSSKVHKAGSTQPVAKWATEFLQKHMSAQNRLHAPLTHTLLLMQDAPLILHHIGNILEQTQQKEVTLFFTHPDPAFVTGFFYRQLEQEFDKRLTTAMYVTDHFIDDPPHVIWNLIDLDLIFVPNPTTELLLQQQLDFWVRTLAHVRGERFAHRPEVRVAAYPQESFFSQPLRPDLHSRRQQELEPDSQKLQVAIPLGGASPGLSWLTEFLQNLPLGFVSPWTVLRQSDDPTVKEYLKAIQSHGGQRKLVENNQQLVAALGEQYSTSNTPTLIFTKPSELTALHVFDLNQIGGAIPVFLEPVGGQEVNNLTALRSAHLGAVLPSESEQRLVWEQVMSDAVDTNLIERARLWRAQCLPPEPAAAADFLVMAKRTGLLQAIGQHKHTCQTPCSLPNGTEQVWRSLEQFLNQRTTPATALR